VPTPISPKAANSKASSMVSMVNPMAFTVSIALIAGYAMVWTGFGVLAFVGDVGLHKLVHAWPWLAAHPQLIAGSVLALAGAFQFSELKERCLTECRHPGSFLVQHYGRGEAAAFRLGRIHGMFCLGCCWALMLVGFAAGVANLWWMAALTALMVFEKTGRRRSRGGADRRRTDHGECDRAPGAGAAPARPELVLSSPERSR
jgi:predicted metal-binding membrane protein